MKSESHTSLPLSLIKQAHGRAVVARRTRVLAESLAAAIPPSSSVLDIGCGDGIIASLIETRLPGTKMQGIEFAPRPNCLIDCAPFDGASIPFPTASFDVSMLVDVLHHTAQISALLAEAARVSRRFILIKDHLSENKLDFATLQFMDWVGNRPYGVVLPYNYQSRSQWDQLFAQSALQLTNWQPHLPIYPFPFSAIFGRKLHFIALLEKHEPSVIQ
jgi:SAM-dependent methyltransferase